MGGRHLSAPHALCNVGPPGIPCKASAARMTKRRATQQDASAPDLAPYLPKDQPVLDQESRSVTARLNTGWRAS